MIFFISPHFGSGSRDFFALSKKYKSKIFASVPCQRPYHAEHTSSRPITEVKQHWARIVLGWETAWEHRVLLAFYFASIYLKTAKTAYFGSAPLPNEADLLKTQVLAVPHCQMKRIC